MQLARVLMKSIVANGGVFNEDHFRDEYVRFMTTPGSHNDTYASSCHRLFFANLVHGKRQPKDCPEDDGHNMGGIDGLVLPTIVALAVGAKPDGTPVKAAQMATACASVTRKNDLLQKVARAWGTLVYQSLRPESVDLQTVLEETATELGFRKPNGVGVD